MTNAELATGYMKTAKKLAWKMSDIFQLIDDFRLLQEETGDNGDPLYELEEAVKPLAKSLVAALNYADEYEKEQEDDTAEK